MKYNFPIINNISDVLPTLEGRDEFIIADRDGFKVVNYLVNYIDTFPEVIGNNISDEQKILGALRRECRGIKFDAETGKIICRPLQKFFNVNEKPETHFANVDISSPHHILAKLDGSFISPFYANGRMIYGTKMGETDVSRIVKAFADKNPRYEEFNSMLLAKGFTPTYEYIGPDNRIVISYKESNLILLAVRKMITGEYLPYDDMNFLAVGFNIPVVDSVLISGGKNSIETYLHYTKNLKDEEGFVIRFENGYSLKIKADDYVLKHKVKDSISQEKNLVELIFSEKIDDVYATLDENDSAKVKKYADAVLKHSSEIVRTMTQVVKDAKLVVGDDKKRFALEIVKQHEKYQAVLFKIWDGKDPHQTVKDFVLKSVGSQSKIEAIRYILGPTVWNDIYTAPRED